MKRILKYTLIASAVEVAVLVVAAGVMAAFAWGGLGR